MIYISLQIQSTLDWFFTNAPQACLFNHSSIKLLISATLFSLPTHSSNIFLNYAEFYLFVNFLFSYKMCIKAFDLQK